MKFSSTTTAAQTFSVALLASAAAAEAADASTSNGYTNPCVEFDTAKILNELYYDESARDGCADGSPSYKCSGWFTHGQDLETGTSNADGANVQTTMPGKYFMVPVMNWTMGSDTLASPVCPTEIYDGEYPWWCPTPEAMTLGSISYSYQRADTAPPVSAIENFDATGIDEYTNSTNRVTLAWPGPGLILVPDGKTLNPEIDSLPSSFWDNDRVGYSWPSDGGTLFRMDCGNGPNVFQVGMGIGATNAGPPADILGGGAVKMQCPPSTTAWKDYAALPTGWDNYCSEDVFSSLDSYYDNYHAELDVLLDLNVTHDDCLANMATMSQKDQLQCNLLLTPQGQACGIPADKFDSIYTPSQSPENFPDWRQEWAEMYPHEFGSGLRETMIKSYHGMGFNQLGNNMVFYADSEDSLKEALEHAADFYEKSRLGGGTPIRIPVVMLDQDKMFQMEDGSQPDIITCPAGATGGSSSSTDNTAAPTSSSTTTTSGDSDSTTAINMADAVPEDTSSASLPLVSSTVAMLSSLVLLFNIAL